MIEQCSLYKHRSEIMKVITISLALLMTVGTRAQSTLDAYISQGLSSNTGIKEHGFKLEQSRYALKEARALFLPSITLFSDYFLARGGRTIDIPVGDIVNPIYAGLNELTGSSSFPQITNASEQLNPNNFYDARLRASAPVFNLEIEYNRRIKQKQVTLQELEVAVYKRELVNEIKAAYFGYLSTVSAISIYRQALDLALENQRINEALFANDQVNRGAVIRSANEVARFEAQVIAAEQNEATARAYFNFLLNRDADASIALDTGYSAPALSQYEPESPLAREELLQLTITQSIHFDRAKLVEASSLPKLSTFIDLGSQGFDWEFDSQSRYYLFGVSLQWDLFTGRRNHYRKQQVELEQRIKAAQVDQTERQLMLQVTTAVNEFSATFALYQAAMSQQASSERYFSDVQSLYKVGQVLFIELLDAQNQWVTAQLQANILLYDLLTKAASIERVTAGYNIN